MDIHVGDLHSTIVDRELEIIQDLLEEIVKHDETIASACDVCAELDCLLSFSEASRSYNLRRPEMTQENYIEIIQGRCALASFECLFLVTCDFFPSRHPIYEQVVDTFVVNDARLLGGAGIGASAVLPDNFHKWNSILLCTGANACGKVSRTDSSDALGLGFSQSVYLKQVSETVSANAWTIDDPFIA